MAANGVQQARSGGAAGTFARLLVLFVAAGTVLLLRTYDIARNQGSITTRNGNNSGTKRLLGKSHIEVIRH
jgi:hypothetical protein